MQPRGFTMIELTLVLALLAIIVGIAGIISSVGTGQNELRNATTDAVDTLRRAREQTMHGRQNDVWGVHFESTAFVFFKGSSYNGSDPTNITTNLNGPVQITGISITGGGNEIIFDDEFGNTSTDGTITFSHSETGESKDVVVNSVGLIEVD